MLANIMKVIVLVCFAVVAGCGDSDLSKSMSKKTIQPCIKEWYGNPVPKTLEFPRHGQYRGFVINAKNLGLIEVTLKHSLYGFLGVESTIEKPSFESLFNAKLTEKGKKNAALSDREGRVIYFPIASIQIDEVLDIKKEQDGNYTVYASIVEKDSDLGRELMQMKGESKPVKSRLKALLSYDKFLKKYVVKKIQSSPWDKEEWGPTRWVEETKEGQRFVVSEMDPL